MSTATTKKIPKTAQLGLRVRPDIKATLTKLAHDDGRSVANYIERLVEQAAERKARKP